MCGRFTLSASATTLVAQFDLADLPAWSPRYNIAPTQEVLAVTKMPDAPKRQLRLLRWGLIPPWAAGPAVGSRMINARAETVAGKPVLQRPRRASRPYRRTRQPLSLTLRTPSDRLPTQPPGICAHRDGQPSGEEHAGSTHRSSSKSAAISALSPAWPRPTTHYRQDQGRDASEHHPASSANPAGRGQVLGGGIWRRRRYHDGTPDGPGRRRR